MVLLELVSFFSAATLAGCPFKGMGAPAGGHMIAPHRPAAKVGDSDPLPQTYQGCKCKSECGATLDIGEGSCDWCYTEGDCGHYDIFRLSYFDYCVYRTDVNWEKQSDEEKMLKTWNKVIADKTPGKYPIIDFANIFVESVQTTFDDMWDIMPAGRKKMIHSVGMVCPIAFKVTSDQYTGIFEKGTQTGFLRLGSALPVTGVTGVVPGIGMKFFRNGVPSANYVTLHSLAPVFNYNMFAQSQSNHIGKGPAFADPLVEKFKQASTCVTQVGLSDVCTWTQNGTKVENPVFPYKIEYRPTGQATMSSWPQLSNQLLKNMIKGAPSGTVLYNVWAMDAPRATPQLMATITTTQNCVSSKFGDEKMFFRHQRIEEDWALKPEWMSQINPEVECGGIKGPLTTTPPKSCSKFTAEGPCTE